MGRVNGLLSNFINNIDFFLFIDIRDVYWKFKEYIFFWSRDCRQDRAQPPFFPILPNFFHFLGPC